MNHKRIRVFALSVILALLAVPCITWAQADCYDESEPGCGPWVDLGPIPLPHTPPIDLNGCGFSFADVQYRNCGGKMEINYSGLTETDIYPGGCEFFKDSSLMQLADLIIMNWMGSLSSGLGFGTPGPCDGGAGGYLTSVQFITTSCYIWQGSDRAGATGLMYTSRQSPRATARKSSNRLDMAQLWNGLL